MKNFLYQVGLNYKRIVLRNLRFFFFSLALPIIFYLLFTKVMNLGIPTPYLSAFHLSYLVEMVVYSALISSVITVSNTLLEDQTHHFTLFVELTPSSKVSYYGGMLAVFLPLSILAVVLLGLVGILANGVTISSTLWLIFILLLPVLSLPLVLIGILISLAGSANLVNVLNQITMFFMAIVGGLWWPVSMLPNWLGNIGRCLPTFQISTIIQEVLYKQAIHLDALGGLLLWTMGLLLALLLAFRVIRGRELQTI